MGATQVLPGLLVASYLLLVIANVACSIIGVYSCSLLLVPRPRPSVRWGRRCFLWNLVAVATISSGARVDVPRQQASLFLLLFLGSQLIALAGYRQDLRHRMARIITGPPHRTNASEPTPEDEPTPGGGPPPEGGPAPEGRPPPEGGALPP